MESTTTTPLKVAAFPIGFFTYTVNGVTPLVEFDGQGGATATLDGEVIVRASYKVTGDKVEIVDVEGSYAYPEGGTGKYKWTLNDEVLTFTLIEDQNPARRKGFAQPFIMQK